MRCAILAGGKATRFEGRPKGLERVGGERILDRVVEAVMASAGETPTLVTNAPDAVEWRADLSVTKDLIPDCGTLGGIYTAVAGGEGPVVVAAWDMPFLNERVIDALIEGSEGYDAFLPESERAGMVEPLCAVYHSRCAEPILECLNQEDFRAVAFHDLVRVGTLPSAVVAKHGDPAKLFFNVNTAADLTRAEELWRERE